MYNQILSMEINQKKGLGWCARFPCTVVKIINYFKTIDI